TLDIRTRVRAWETNGLLRAQVTGNWKENRLVAHADFDKTGMLPVKGDLSIPQFDLPGELIKAPSIKQLKGNLQGTWETNQFSIKTSGEVIPLSDNALELPILHFETRATGNTNNATIQELVVSGVDTHIRLTSPLQVSFKGEMLSPETALEIQSKLDSLPWIKAAGDISGTILARKNNKIPDLAVDLSGTNIVGYGVQAERLSMEGSFKWPMVEQLKATLQMPGGGRALLSVNGANITNKSIVQGEVYWDGHFGHPSIPTNISYTNLTLHATISGSFTQLTHQAELSIYRLVVPQLRPLDIEAKWSGTNAALSELQFEAKAGPSTLRLSGSVTPALASTNLHISKLYLLKGDEPELSLAKPVTITYKSFPTPTNQIHSIHISAFEWLGTTNGIRVEGNVSWPEQGNVKISVDSFDPRIFQFFTERSLGGVQIQKFESDLQWDQSAVMGSITGRVSAAHSSFQMVTASFGAQADVEGLSIHNFLVSDPFGDVIKANGFLPLTVNPLSTNKKVRLARREQFAFKASTIPNTNFWQTISDLAKARFSQPHLDITVSGTARDPQGHIIFSCSALELSKITKEIPNIENIAANLFINEAEARLEHFGVTLEQQPVRAKGVVHLGSNFWHTSRINLKDHVLENSHLQIEATQFQIAPLAKFAPQYVVPQGSFNINVALAPGKNLEGQVTFTNIATRPIGSLGPVDAIHGNVNFSGRQVEIKRFSAVLGGEQLNMNGSLDLSEEKMATGYPGIRIKIDGKNLPLARNPNIILRSDLDLLVSNSATNVPVVTGKVNLQDSFFLSDLESLVPGKISRPEKRPPYFSIDRDPFGAWKLDLNVSGKDFMRVRSPFFQGQVSAAFRVVGTMQEPIALGETLISNGRINFPFANLDVKQGIVSLTSDDPYNPQVFVLAGARTFGYDVTMEARGPANNLVIEFSSVPSLTSEEIVLMLTTGALPRSDFSFSNEQKASKLAVFLGKSLWSKFSGDDGGSERLSIRSGEDISEQGRQTYKVEYMLSDRWSLIGEYDRFGAVNAGVKWKVLTR
ncbi:MAG: translocation/assembly module TamB domain-containing protein, partial [Verrucomicrobiales bacterium]